MTHPHYFLDVYTNKFHFIFPSYQYYFVPLHRFLYMKTKSLAFIAGIIWLFAGFNVCRIDIHLYPSLP